MAIDRDVRKRPPLLGARHGVCGAPDAVPVPEQATLLLIGPISVTPRVKPSPALLTVNPSNLQSMPWLHAYCWACTAVAGKSWVTPSSLHVGEGPCACRNRKRM
jgi:hypothetical protein